MVDASRIYSAGYQRAQQRRFNVIGGIGLLGFTLALGLVLTRGISATPILIIVACVALTAVVLIWRKAVVAVYILLAGTLLFDQWPIAGLDPITLRAHFFQSLSGFTPIKIPINPAEMVLFLALAAILLPAWAGVGPKFYRGSLYGPVMFFLVAVIASFVYGFAHTGPTGTPFNINAAWVECRSFISLIIGYFIVCNLITTRKRLETFVWIIIVAIGLKGIQGIDHYFYEKQHGLHLEALTGHEDVVFFATFFLLLIGLKLYGHHKTQIKAMMWLLLPVVITEFVTGRRLAFLILPMGFAIFGITLLKTNRALFFKIVPAVTIAVALYTAIFWNHTGGAIGEPIRAFRSQFGYTSQRDELSDVWRELEKKNIAFNIKKSSLMGLGFGREYEMAIAEPSLDSTGFIYWTYITHNSIFWVWMDMGLIGFIAFWFLLGSGIVKGLIIFRSLSDGYLRAISLLAVSLIAMQILYSYGDLGLTYARPMIYLGFMLGLLVRLPSLDPKPQVSKEQVPAQLAEQGATHK